MENIFISVCVFNLIFGIESLIKVDETLPQISSDQKLFPALILKKNNFLKNDPAVPNDTVVKKKSEKFKFELFDVHWEQFNNLRISYVCPKENNPSELEHTKKRQCKNELQVISFMNGYSCGGPEDDSREYYYIGYGVAKESCIIPCTHNPNNENNKVVEYRLYKSCFDNEQNLVYHVKYVLRSRNNLYHRFDEIYPEKVREEIAQLEQDYRLKMAEKFKKPHVVLFEEGGEGNAEESHLIPFQLVSHQDMILYNWKLATFNEKNYSLIWSNIAKNAWKQVNEFLRKLMITSNCNIEVYSGVHQYSEDDYPLYVWKFVHCEMRGIAIVIHNHPRNDHREYPHLCQDFNHNCERYSYYANEKDKNIGYTYCCPTKALREKIPFFNRFKEFESLEFGYLCDTSVPLAPYKELYTLETLDLSPSDMTERQNLSSEQSQTLSEVEIEQPVERKFETTPSLNLKVEETKNEMSSIGADPEFFNRKGKQIQASRVEGKIAVEQNLQKKSSMNVRVEETKDKLSSIGADKGFFDQKGVEIQA